MPLLTSFQAAVGGVCVILIYGIVMEKHYVSKSTVFYNILSLLLLLASIELPLTVLAGMILYLVIGFIIMKLHIKLLFPTFGARTYGSLALVLVLHGEGFIPYLGGRDLASTFTIIMIFWIAVAISVNLMGYIYKKYF
ncbi:MAG: hypothetical protein ACOC53_01690 [Candidatus Saliniplasma sp.]